MVEMTEVANILRNATSKSLLILDEIGRGDKYFLTVLVLPGQLWNISVNGKRLGGKDAFLQHIYHELTELEGKD